MSSNTDNSEPSEILTSKPFESLNDLYSNLNELNPWPEVKDLHETIDYVYSGKSINDVKKPLTRLARGDKPKTLVCHDMRGGYLDDRFVGGCGACDPYVFYHWSVIDTFVYFSHKFVTVPPYGWINAAHIHGVKILGTVITEWKDGEKVSQDIFESESETIRFADALIELAKFYKFDGWLLNVENEIRKDDIEKLKSFVKYLTDGIHKEVKNSEIIWYDSVTRDGELKWQNELNDFNKCFFDASDGIFLNYNWSETTLAKSRMKVGEEKRLRNVYVGLDVWGRGCPGGGGFQSEYALRKIREHDMSVAIFAPGWTHEYFGNETFEDTENLFWAQLVPYLYIHVPLYDNEIFRTSFCRGVGLANYREGQLQAGIQASEDSCPKDVEYFFNLSLQCPQISVPTPGLVFVIKPEVKEEKTVIESNLLKKNETESGGLSKNFNPETNTTEKEVKDVFYETEKSVIKVRGDTIIFREKTPSPDLNYFTFSYCSSYNGGGCLQLITKNPEQYHRLLLIEVKFKRGIQISLVYNDADADQTEQIEPILVTGDENSVKLIRSYKTEEVNFPWRRNFYLTKLNSISQIGLAVAKPGTITVGEILIEEEEAAANLHSSMLTLFGTVLIIFSL